MFPTGIGPCPSEFAKAAGRHQSFDRRPRRFNRYPEQVTQHQPQYAGGVVWNRQLRDQRHPRLVFAAGTRYIRLPQIQKVMRAVAPYSDTITSWLEPHGELSHSPCDLLIDFGPDADKSYRKFLKTALSGARRCLAPIRRQRRRNCFLGRRAEFPELASFLGWGPTAIDLAGTWKISYKRRSRHRRPRWIWTIRSGPRSSRGHQIIVHLPRKPAVFRRQVTIDAAWRAAHPRVWLYLWDLNDTRPNADRRHDVLVFVNGRPVIESPVRREEGHWAMLEVSKFLKDGATR